MESRSDVATEHALARCSWLARQRGHRLLSAMVAAALLGCLSIGGRARAAEGVAAPTAAATEPTPLPSAALPVEASPQPALDLKAPAPEPEPAKPSLFGRWWFWTAVGVAAAATVAVIVVSSGGSAPPASDLGNQEFQP